MKPRKKVSSVIKKLKRKWKTYSTLEDYIIKNQLGQNRMNIHVRKNNNTHKETGAK